MARLPPSAVPRMASQRPRSRSGRWAEPQFAPRQGATPRSRAALSVPVRRERAAWVRPAGPARPRRRQPPGPPLLYPPRRAARRVVFLLLGRSPLGTARRDGADHCPTCCCPRFGQSGFASRSCLLVRRNQRDPAAGSDGGRMQFVVPTTWLRFALAPASARTAERLPHDDVVDQAFHGRQVVGVDHRGLRHRSQPPRAQRDFFENRIACGQRGVMKLFV